MNNKISLTFPEELTKLKAKVLSMKGNVKDLKDMDGGEAFIMTVDGTKDSI